ncbi:MAG: hypothetical protein J6A15_01475 [Clostridia bacterium]|nr:hypothetical protein [Clostridia bacterium]
MNEQEKKVVEEIRSKLTGDKEKDKEYLLEEAKKYKGNPDASNIVKEIGKMLFEVLPEEKIEYFSSVVEKDVDAINAKVDEAYKIMSSPDRDMAKAKEILLDVINKPFKFIENDEERYFSFNNVLEFFTSKYVLNINKKAVWITANYALAYNLLTFISNEEHDFDKALEYADKALYYNPMDLNTAYEKAETYKIQRKYEQMLKVTLDIYDYIFTPEHLARYYRNLGYFYTEACNFELSFSLYLISMLYQESKGAYHEILYIKQVLKNPEYNVDLDTAFSMLEKNNIPIGIKKENFNILYSLYLNEDIRKNDPGTIKELKRRLYKFTNDKQFLD